jgi:hypothetical protein
MFPLHLVESVDIPGCSRPYTFTDQPGAGSLSTDVRVKGLKARMAAVSGVQTRTSISLSINLGRSWCDDAD